MNIAQVSHRFLPNVGGVERHVADLARELTKKGHEVTVLTTDDTSTPPRQDHEPESSYRVRRFPTLLRRVPVVQRGLLARGLYRAILEEKPDLIHAQGYAFYSWNAAWFAARKLKVPLVTTPHYYAEANNQLPWAVSAALSAYDHTLGKRILKQDASAVCAVAPTEGRILLKRFGLDPHRLHWTPNAIDPAECTGKPGFAKQYGIQGDFLLCLGRLCPQKGQHHLVNIAKHLDTTIVIAGPDTGDGAMLRSLAEKNGCLDRIRFTGALSREMALSALHECRALVMPSHWEAFSITLLEAWANRTAVAISDAGGTPDVVTHGRDGLIHRVGDEGMLLEHVRALVDDRNLCRRLGAAGRDNVDTKYTWEAATARIQAAYGLAPRGETIKLYPEIVEAAGVPARQTV